MQYLQDPTSERNTFLPIPTHAGYAVNPQTGAVVNLKTGRQLKTRPRKSAVRYYVACRIGSIHRLLMSAVMARPLERQELVCHDDGNTFNNAISNLVLGSAQQNARDRIATNTNGRFLRNQQIREIRHLASRVPTKELARRFGISTAHVRRIITGARWQNLPW